MRRIHSILIALIAMIAISIAVAENHSAPARTGKVVFEANCANCHTGGIGGFFSGAPDIDDADDWQALVPKGIDGLTATTISGIGEMAARGACTECTDEEIRAAVEHILEAVQ